MCRLRLGTPHVALIIYGTSTDKILFELCDRTWGIDDVNGFIALVAPVILIKVPVEPTDVE